METSGVAQGKLSAVEQAVVVYESRENLILRGGVLNAGSGFFHKKRHPNVSDVSFLDAATTYPPGG